ncbi:MAG: hypothetical protein ACI3WT_07740 [Phascolarctobacterium sp.]
MILIRRCFTVCMLVSALFCFALPCMSAVPVEQVPTGYKVVPTEKLELLKSNNDKLVLKLAELEQKLALLKTPSTELVEQLTIAKSELQLSKQELASAKLSLKSVKSLQEETLNSLTSLEKKIDAERKQQANREKRLRRQRDTWMFVAGAALVAYIAK